MTLVFDYADETDAPAIAALRAAVAERLTERYGTGHWSSVATDKGVRRGIRESRVLLARRGGAIVGSLRLATKKPWAIDVAYFRKVPRALYLADMAVAPELQRSGIGRAMLDEAARRSREFPAQAIRLDAYDAEAGAGGFYARAGFTEVGRVTYRGVPLIYYELIL